MMFWHRSDKRQFPRADYLCKLVVFRQDSKKLFTTHTTNIGLTGLCVLLPEQLVTHCPVEALLYLEDGGAPVECKGHIVWILKRRLNFATGIELIELKEDDKKRIDSIIKKCLHRKK